MAAIFTTRFLEKAPELFAYQASIVRAERNYEGNQWVAYDRQYRWETLARKDLYWSIPNLRLYNETFTGMGQVDSEVHLLPTGQPFGSPVSQEPSQTSAKRRYCLADTTNSRVGPPPSQDICRTYNEGRCRKSQCRYWHACLSCQEAHVAIHCLRSLHQRLRGSRSRSPFKRSLLRDQRP